MKTIRYINKWLPGATLFLLFFMWSGAIVAQTGGAIYEVGPLMNKERIFPFSATLDDGRVVAFGGREVGFVSGINADIYDPESNTFTEVTMNYPHDGTCVLKLDDGRYLILGGSYDWGIPAITSTELFDPETDVFSISGDMVYPRMQLAAAQLDNGKILIAGAWYNTEAATYGEIYDLTTGSSTLTGALLNPRAQTLVLPTDDGGAVVCGGWTSYGETMVMAVEYYDKSTNSFSLLSSELIPEDPGWITYSNMKVIADQRLDNDNYIMLAYRYDPDLEYALITFDPELKTFSKVATFNTTEDALTDGGIFDFVLDKDANYAYLLAADALFDPIHVGLIAVDLDNGNKYYPPDSYVLPVSEYLSPTLVFMPENDKILLMGISSATGSYFYATDKTYLLTPTINVGIENMEFTNQNIYCYPNPVMNNFTVYMSSILPDKYTINLVDIAGRTVWSEVKTESGTGEASWNFSGLNVPSGIYQLTISGKSDRFSIPVLVNK